MLKKAGKSNYPKDFGFGIVRDGQRHSVSPTLMRLLPSYIQWADVVHLTGVYNFPTFPTIWRTRSLRRPLIWSPRGALQRWKGSSRIGAKKIWDWLWYHTADRNRFDDARYIGIRIPRDFGSLP